MRFKTGTPFNLITGSDAAVLGRTISQPDLSRSQLPRSAFSYIQPGEERGNLGRHTFWRATFRNGNAGLTGQ